MTKDGTGSEIDRPWLPEGAIEKVTLDPRLAIVLHVGEGGTWTVAALAGLVKLYPKMLALLRELEWCDTGERGFSNSDKPDTRCPVCSEYGYDGHSPDCRLNALLDRLGRG